MEDDKNKDTAFPQVYSVPGYFVAKLGDNETQIVSEIKSVGGLTKQEYFSGLAMRALISGYRLRVVPNQKTMEMMAKLSVGFAAALIDELNKNEE